VHLQPRGGAVHVGAGVASFATDAAQILVTEIQTRSQRWSYSSRQLLKAECRGDDAGPLVSGDPLKACTFR
jgi:hypothetical protein